MEKLIETSVSSLGVTLTAVIVTAIGVAAVFLYFSSKMKKNKTELEERVERLEKNEAVTIQRVTNNEKRLDEGNDRFNSMDVSLRNINSSIERLTGMVEMFFRSQGLGSK